MPKVPVTKTYLCCPQLFPFLYPGFSLIKSEHSTEFQLTEKLKKDYPFAPDFASKEPGIHNLFNKNFNDLFSNCIWWLLLE
jgi:hypothetical protein